MDLDISPHDKVPGWYLEATHVFPRLIRNFEREGYPIVQLSSDTVYL